MLWGMVCMVWCEVRRGVAQKCVRCMQYAFSVACVAVWHMCILECIARCGMWSVWCVVWSAWYVVRSVWRGWCSMWGEWRVVWCGWCAQQALPSVGLTAFVASAHPPPLSSLVVNAQALGKCYHGWSYTRQSIKDHLALWQSEEIPSSITTYR